MTDLDPEVAGILASASVPTPAPLGPVGNPRPTDEYDGRPPPEHYPDRQRVADLGADSPGGERTSWWPVDPDPYLDDSDDGEPPPALLRRADGKALLYPATVNALYGESESMKSWCAQFAAAQAVDAGHLVVYVDFESTGRKVYGRLRSLGVERDALVKHLRYIRPVDPLDPAAGRDLDEVLAQRPALVVLDGITEALELFGLDLVSNSDWAKFNRALPRRCADGGAAVVLVDHVTKAAQEGGRRYALGAQHKRASIDGAAYMLTALRPFGRGLHGAARLAVVKDRPGHVRGEADGQGQAAVLHLRSDAVDGAVTASLDQPGEAAGDTETFRPTTLMEKVSRYLETADEPQSQRQVEAAKLGKGEYVRRALAVLVDEGYAARSSGSRGAQMHTTVRPYRALDDPLDPDRVPPRPDRVPDAVGPPRPASRVPTGDADADAADRPPDAVTASLPL